MSRISHVSESVQPICVAVSLADTDADIQHLAAHKIAAQFSIPVSVAKVVVSLAGIGGHQ
jgi:hypothetical protein